MGQPILQIPAVRPTEIITVEFSPHEGNLYRCANDKLQQLRERARDRKAGGGSEDIPKGQLRKYFNYLRYFTSHPALVEPGYLNQKAPQPQVLGIMGVEEVIATHEISKKEEPPAPYYYCRMCRNALIDPRIGEVRVICNTPVPLLASGSLM